jgi:Uncharacterised nucleotidyltransferase
VRAADLDEFIARARGLRRREELDRATIVALTAFESAGIDALLLKGPALAERLYNQGESRGYTDIDLLIAPRDLTAARRVLIGLGYDEVVLVPGIDDVAGIQHSEIWNRPGERGGPIWIDLHWRLDPCEAPGDAIWDALAASRGSINLSGRPVAILSDDGLALHLALHAAQHGPDDTKAMADLARGIERWSSAVWRSAAELAEDVRGRPAFAAGLRLLPAGARLASQLGLPPTPELDWEIRIRASRPRGTFHLQALTEARGVGEHLNVLRRSLVPNPQWIRWEFPWAARGRAALVVGYARHLARAPRWAVRAMRYRRRVRGAAGGG